MIIDTHAHLYPERFLDLIEAQGNKYPVSIAKNAEGLRVLRFDEKDFFTFHPGFIDVDVRLADMEAAEIDFQVLSIAPPMVFWADPELGRELCQVYNDELMATVRRHPGKFAALAALPLQDTPSAIAELRRAVKELGMKGCLLGSNIRLKDLDGEQFEDFFKELGELGVPAYIHPIMPAGRERMREYRLDVLVGFPVDTTLSAARLVYSGVMERHPGLRIVLSHCGGTLPFLWGRLSRGFESFLEDEVDLKFSGKPEDHFKKFYFDSITYEPEILEFAAKWAGLDHIVFGTDNPFFGSKNMRDCVSMIRACTGFSEAEKNAVFAETPARLFGIDLPAGS